MYYLVKWQMASECDWMLIAKGKNKRECNVTEIICIKPQYHYYIGGNYKVDDEELIDQDDDLNSLRERAYLYLL